LVLYQYQQLKIYFRICDRYLFFTVVIGQDYIPLLTNYADSYGGYLLTNFNTDMWAALLCGIGWGIVAMLIMICTSLDKKK